MLNHLKNKYENVNLLPPSLEVENEKVRKKRPE